METWMPDIFEQIETRQLGETFPSKLNAAFKNIQAKSRLEIDHNAILILEGWGPHHMVQEHVPPTSKRRKDREGAKLSELSEPASGKFLVSDASVTFWSQLLSSSAMFLYFPVATNLYENVPSSHLVERQEKH